MKNSMEQSVLLLIVLMLLPYSRDVISVDYNYIPDKDGKNGITITTAEGEITTISVSTGSIVPNGLCNRIVGTTLCVVYEDDNTISIFNSDDFLDAKASTILSDSATSIWDDFFIFIDISIMGDGFGIIITPWYESFLKKGIRSTETEVTPKSYSNEQCREKPCQEEYPGGKTVTLIAKPEKNSSLTALDCGEGKTIVDKKRYEVTCKAQFDLIPCLSNECPLLSPSMEAGASTIPPSGSIFRGGVFIESELPQKAIELNSSSEVDIKGIIEVNTQHQGQSAEILVVGSYVSSNSQDPIFYMRDGNDNVKLWDKDPSRLLAFKTVLLTEMQQLTLYQGLLPIGSWAIYFGYRLRDGSIIYNSEPIKVNIIQS